ncbi:MAG: pitrilysin family protein [bacterium]|jgi:zinc protease|nr:pitrilysin family protein [bacterium]
MRAHAILPALLLALRLAVPAGAAAIAGHPDQLSFPPLVYHPPVAKEYRHQLKNGVTVFVVEDRRVPLVDVAFHIRADNKQVPRHLDGLHGAAFVLMTSAGSGKHDATWIEEETAFLGARLDSRPDTFGGIVTLQTLTKDLDRGLDIAFELLRDPRYQEDRVRELQDRVLASFKKRNDSPEDLERAEWRRLIYNDEEYRPGTQASIEAITPAALRQWHDRWVQPRHLVITVSGDVTAKDILPRLEKRMKDWRGEEQRFTSPEPGYAVVAPGVYLIHKPVNQSRVRCFLPGLDRDDPRWQAAWLMNELLGGGGMSSRLLNRIRTEEGLAYSVGSQLEEREFGRGLLWAAFQTKTESTQYAMSLLVEELERMAAGNIDEQALADAKNQVILAFPTWFSSAQAIAGSLADEELSGRAKSNPGYYQDLRDKVAAVTVEDVRAMARDLLRPGQLIWLVVGDAAAVTRPDEAKGLTLERFGPVTRLPLRDPMTQEPLPFD